MSDTYLSKKAFADILAIRQVVILLVNDLPDEKKAIIKDLLTKSANTFSSKKLPESLETPQEVLDEMNKLIAESCVTLAETILIPEETSSSYHQ